MAAREPLCDTCRYRQGAGCHQARLGMSPDWRTTGGWLRPNTKPGTAPPECPRYQKGVNRDGPDPL